jgi:hypothetical protein
VDAKRRPDRPPTAEEWLALDIARWSGEVEKRKRDELEAWKAMKVAEAPVEVTGEHHSPDEVARRRATWNGASGALDAATYELDQLKAQQRTEQRARGCTSARPRHVPVLRARTTARPRERREQRRTRRTSSSSSSDDGSRSTDDPDPPGLAGVLVLRARGPPRPPLYAVDRPPAADDTEWAAERAVGAAAPTEAPEGRVISKQLVPIVPDETDGIERRPLVHTAAPTRITNAQLADQLLTIAIELDRRGALKRARDRRYRARRISEQRRLHVVPGSAA